MAEEVSVSWGSRGHRNVCCLRGGNQDTRRLGNPLAGVLWVEFPGGAVLPLAREGRRHRQTKNSRLERNSCNGKEGRL